MRSCNQSPRSLSSSRRGAIGLFAWRECCLVMVVCAAIASAVSFVPGARSSQSAASNAPACLISGLTLNGAGTELWVSYSRLGLARRTLGDSEEEFIFRKREDLADLAVHVGEGENVFALALLDGTLEIWRNEHIEWAGQLTSNNKRFISVVIANDGRTIFAIAEDGELFRLNRGGTIDIAAYSTGRDPGRLRVSPDGRRLAWPAGSNAIIVWDVEQSTELACWQSPHVHCTDVAWSPCGRRLASVGTGGRLCLWNIDDQQLCWSIQADVWDSQAVIFSSDGQQILTGGFDRCVRLWHADSGRQQRQLPISQQPVRTLACSADGKTIYGGTLDGRLVVLSL